ncbi:MAG TPA: toll/interleukin-1 receptor domain-containing protein [Pyrinomonadaceae bacterium]|jgi:hypothetical protein|nr:toll/interleukin-1 receptor domain-containing protein [Pyrinomonadaceae bacterium]
MAQLFISHAEEDRASALEIGAALERRGFAVWFYERDCVPGPPYLVQVSEAIAQCEGVILIISPASMDSHQVDAEVSLAFDSRKRFVPVLSGVTYDEFRKRRPDWWLASRAATSVTLPPDGASAILDQIENGVRRLGVNPTPRPTRDKGGARKKASEPSAAHPKGSTKAYLCYADEDRERVLERAQELSAAGMFILDVDRETKSFAERNEQMRRKIDEADVFYLFWSAATANSPWVTLEMGHANRRRTENPDKLPHIVQVSLDGLVAPEVKGSYTLIFDGHPSIVPGYLLERLPRKK